MTFGWFFAFAAFTAFACLCSFLVGAMLGLESGRNENLATAVKKSLKPSVN